ncbi:MAG: MATE family efflux transporter [Bacillota bacterium]|nr:MATE family efflux transporter [Bacillota bacterium]
MSQQSERLGKEPIPKLLTELGVPAFIGLFMMGFYNIVDTIFIARGVGTLGVAGASIAFPAQMIISSIAGALGIGGASVISRRLGSNNPDEADQVFGNVIGLVLIVSIIGVFFGLSMLTPLLRLFGASDTIMPYARDYLGIILFGTVFFAFLFSMGNIVRSEGSAKTAMAAMLISSCLNIILTPIFIFRFGMGIKGAAIATVLSQVAGALYILVYFASGKSTLSFKISNLRPRIPLIKEVLAIGASAFVRFSSLSIMLVVANNMLLIYGGDLSVAVFGIIHKVLMFSIMPMNGVVQGLLPIVGFNYGAKQPKRISESILLGMKAATLIAVIAFLMIMLFPKQIMLIFTNDAAAIESGQFALRIIFIISFTIGVSMVTSGVFQALGNARAALLLSLSRQVLFLIPLLLILPPIFKLTGVWIAFPLADLLSFLLSLWYIKQYKSFFSLTPSLKEAASPL